MWFAAPRASKPWSDQAHVNYIAAASTDVTLQGLDERPGDDLNYLYQPELHFGHDMTMRLRTLVIWGTTLWALAVIGFFYYLLWLQTRQPYTPIGFLDDTSGEQLFNAARTSATLLGVSGLGGAALIAYRRQRSTEETLDNERTSALHERYTTAAEQLGHERAAIRLAGVYGLASLSDDWQAVGRPGEAQTGVDLLCAYLRADDVHLSDDRDSDVRLAIIESIRSRLVTSPPRQKSNLGWHGHRFDLSRSDLHEARFVGADLVGMDLTGTNLRRADLSRCTLSVDVRIRDSFAEQLEESMRSKKAPPPPRDDTEYIGAVLADVDLYQARMRGAKLPGCILDEVDMRGADLGAADLTQAELATTNLAGAKLVGARLAGAKLHDVRIGGVHHFVNLSGADLADADLKDAIVGEANFTGANLRGADLRFTDLSSAVLTDTTHDETTQWPSDFDPPK
ncbi:pentapeptide repeat-containing protein [Rhodococcus oxybenzonivorans]|uniref:pentapeptide repeat-containing protein n=1 Tax=Rhodococcus oxybenzonivorans TaxID=1990687 RepID=UPI002952C718|nr:pentapeptide repeat-containing protein [Rhodococcus oxybenzonivorans]MDV7357692.1 pentapeptide repeat-containing protein [Rhodococcus oxybenzonivorans]